METILRLPEVRKRTGLSKSTIYNLIKMGELNPPIRLGTRAVGWLESDITHFIEGRKRVANVNSSINNGGMCSGNSMSKTHENELRGWHHEKK